MVDQFFLGAVLLASMFVAVAIARGALDLVLHFMTVSRQPDRLPDVTLEHL